MLRQVLKPFKVILGNHIPIHANRTEMKLPVIEPESKSKYFYNKLIEQIKERPRSETKIRNILNNNTIDFRRAYVTKIKMVKEQKLSEFNYKCIHNILPCNKNLKKWGKINHDRCDVCTETQDITHLLIDCPYAKAIWNFINNALGLSLTTQDIMLGYPDKHINFIISLTAFLIYKEWLICKTNGKAREYRHIYRNVLYNIN